MFSSFYVLMCSVGDHAMSPSIKSKLVNVKWIDKDFKRKFRNATSLSTIFVMDAL